jgi:glycosidase
MALERTPPPSLALRLALPGLSDAPVDAAAHFFHVRRAARDEYGFADSLFSVRGDVVFVSPYEAHVFAEVWNRRNGLPPDLGLRPAEVNAMGLIHEVLHGVIALHRARAEASPLAELVAALRASLGDELDATLRAFVDVFPPPSVYPGRESASQFLGGATDGIPNAEWILEELILVWITNQNPGYAPLRELISDEELQRDTPYRAILSAVTAFFAGQPRMGPDDQTLIELLLAPIRHAPTSVAGQLEFMRERWGLLLGGSDAWQRLLLGIDLINEEERGLARARRGPHEHGGAPEGDVTPLSFHGAYYDAEPEAFSADHDWMPRVVMMAKSTFVWLDQLSKRHGRAIETLRDIPDEELDTLAARGFTALWLIGLWRRSHASRRIKQLHGAHDAVASAYSLFDYDIAPELGGWDAYANLRERAARRGIRLASDMVPNHMGIDSSWVVNHPDWFIQSNEPPFPGYTFDGVDLSDDPRVGIFLEDGYWSRTDAAVVFKRLDRHTGDVKYIYHGNDGTSMPWNDTAQLDYLRADVREAVIQTILHVARLFPIIRFDAAMTLAKRHYQRLWFPLPGSGGDIPSRAQHALSRERFESLFPVEFWREVVDRVAAEVPDTLLLAEAFWMMEGYFVRTLGMHRVYNSAFMNMLKREENQSFRTSIKNVLEFNPQILKRHVNFMNNPDEEPAVSQFGKDDKYFGVCVLMATMPGLPMFGHGQVEGFAEKYGMEFKRPKWDEPVDDGLVARHEREIFPLLARRYVFSDVENFFLYDVFTPEGHVDEDVIAFSNGARGERALVVYHNRYKEARGWVRTSVGHLDCGGRITQRTLAEGLDLPWEAPPGGRDLFLVFRDAVTNLEYLRECRELVERGLYLELGAFKYHVFWNLRVVASSAASPYRALAGELAGRGVPSVEEALARRVRQPIHASLYEAIAPGSVRYLADGWDAEEEAPTAEATRALHRKLADIEDGLRYAFGALDDTAAAHAALESRYARIIASAARTASAVDQGDTASAGPDEAALVESVLHAWLFVAAVENVSSLVPRDARPDGAFDGWELASVVARALTEAGHDAVRVQAGIQLLRQLASGALADDTDAIRRSIRARPEDEAPSDAPGAAKPSTPDASEESTPVDPPEKRPAGS